MTRSRTVWMAVGLALFIAATVVRAQGVELKPGVWFLESTGEYPRNAGWIEFKDHVLLIDGGYPWAAASVVEAVRRKTAKPIRFAVETSGGAPRPRSAVETGATALVPEGRGGAGLAFASLTTLSDGKRRVVLVPLGRAASRRDVAVWLPQEKVLFAGDTFAPSLRAKFPDADFEAWLGALERLKGLGPEIAVGGARAPFTRASTWVWRDILRGLAAAVKEATALGADPRLLAALQEVATRETREARASGHNEEWGGATLGFLTQMSEQYLGRVAPRHLIETYGLREGYTPTRTTPGWTRPKKVVVRARSRDRARWLARAIDGTLVVAAASESAALEEIADADGVIGFCSQAILEKGKKLRWIQVGSAGVDRYINVPGLQERHEIVLTNMQRIYGPEIAEHVFGMLLALTRGLTVAIPLQKDGVWGRSQIGRRSPFVELRGKTLLVVGLGGIGTEVARLGHGLGMRVIATRNSRRTGPPFVEKIGLAADLLAMTPEADVVVNCTPLTPATTRLFNADYFAAMKPAAYFLNIGRGKSVVTAALMKALGEKRIAGAGLDVTDPEPLPPDHPLWKMDRVVITPHISARSDVRLERVWKLYRENLRRFVVGERLLNVVNKKRGY